MVAGGPRRKVITERMSDPQVSFLGFYPSHIFHPGLKGSGFKQDSESHNNVKSIWCNNTLEMDLI